MATTGSWSRCAYGAAGHRLAERRHDCCDGPGPSRSPLDAWQPNVIPNHNSPLPNGLSRGPTATANANKHASPRYGQHKTTCRAHSNASALVVCFSDT